MPSMIDEKRTPIGVFSLFLNFSILSMNKTKIGGISNGNQKKN